MREPADWSRFDLLTERASTTPNRTAIIEMDPCGGAANTLTYDDLHSRVDRLAAVFDRRGIRGGRVGILMGTRLEFANTFFASMRVGSALVPLSVRETTGELESKVDQAGIDALVCEAETASLALSCTDGPVLCVDDADHVAVPDPTADEPIDHVNPEQSGRFESVTTMGEWDSTDEDDEWVGDVMTTNGDDERAGDVMTTNGDDERAGDVMTTYGDDELTGVISNSQSQSNSVKPAPLDRNTTVLVPFTSGTTGQPKGVRLTLGNLLASATASAFRLGVLPTDRWLSPLPMYHVGGLSPMIRSTLYGTTTVLQRPFEAEQTIDVIESYDVTGVSLVPTMLSRLLDAGWEPPETLRFVLLGGAPATASLRRRCEAAPIPIYPTYGMTETASQITTATPSEAFAHEGTVGRPLQWTSVTVVDEDGAELPPFERGEIVVSGPTVTPGYLDPERTAAAMGAGGFQTGDVGYRDESGRLWVGNRRSDRIVTGGENVDPEEVATVLRSHPNVEEATVVGLTDEEWGQRIGALIVLEESVVESEGASKNEGVRSSFVDEVLAHCDGRLASFKHPKTVGVEDELPRTPTGTVDREAVRDRLVTTGIDVTTDRTADE